MEKIINGVGSILKGIFDILKRGIRYLLIGVSIGILSLVLLISAILYTMF